MRDAYIIPVNKSCPGTAIFAALWLPDNSSLLILQCQGTGHAHIEFVAGVGDEKCRAELVSSHHCLCLSCIVFISERWGLMVGKPCGFAREPSRCRARWCGKGRSWRGWFLPGSTRKHCVCSGQSAQQKACSQPGTKLPGFICWQTCCFNIDNT